ncbi:hypothetical protein U9M48_020433 [Paspalum notatum var. saurae]|uniref:Uncharacterized protein n=1 Tax=Paspalum notatum var. saurae TaxID=547442 RepID=A0AAQ3TGV7_PASNO
MGRAVAWLPIAREAARTRRLLNSHPSPPPSRVQTLPIQSQHPGEEEHGTARRAVGSTLQPNSQRREEEEGSQSCVPAGVRPSIHPSESAGPCGAAPSWRRGCGGSRTPVSHVVVRAEGCGRQGHPQAGRHADGRRRVQDPAAPRPQAAAVPAARRQSAGMQRPLLHAQLCR